jgi:hypothetical protein
VTFHRRWRYQAGLGALESLAKAPLLGLCRLSSFFVCQLSHSSFVPLSTNRNNGQKCAEVSRKRKNGAINLLMQWKPREQKIRFSSASNAFSSYAKILGCNGCRPSCSAFPTPSVLHSRGVQVLTGLLRMEMGGAKLELVT